MHRLATSFAGALQASGVERGDRVATLLPNVPEMLVAHFAVRGAGGVIVPINTRLGIAECAYNLRRSQAALLLVHHTWVSVAVAASRALDEPVRIVVVGGQVSGLEEFGEWVADSVPLDLELPADEQTLLSLSYTSGTTGEPKGAMYSHRGAHLHTLG